MVAYLEHPHPIPFAHRGGAGDWPENTMPAFEHAVGLGYRYLETDVHLSADGVVVAFHDSELDRVTDGSGAIGTHTWSELARVRVGGSETIPRLDDLLTTFPEARFNIDTKSDEVVEPLLGLLESAGAIDRVCVGSFSETRLQRVREWGGPRLCTALGPRGTARLTARSFKMPVTVPEAHCAQVPLAHKGVPVLTDRFLDRAHELGLRVHVWTIDDGDQMRALLDRGVDGVMTDRPAVLRDVMVERDEWHPA